MTGSQRLKFQRFGSIRWESINKVINFRNELKLHSYSSLYLFSLCIYIYIYITQKRKVVLCVLQSNGLLFTTTRTSVLSWWKKSSDIFMTIFKWTWRDSNKKQSTNIPTARNVLAYLCRKLKTQLNDHY